LEAPDELAQGRSIDLSIQFLLFWLPLLVLLAWIAKKPLTLLFGMCHLCLMTLLELTRAVDVFEVASAIGACLLVNYATQDGKTNWVEGIILIVFYVMIVSTVSDCLGRLFTLYFCRLSRHGFTMVN
jgi:Ca2+:H+ antiporter